MPYDLIICMPGTGDNEGFDVARTIKAQYEHIPMVILTPFSHGITKRIANEDLSSFDYIFCWLGKHRLAGFHHQADRGQDESGTRRQ